MRREHFLADKLRTVLMIASLWDEQGVAAATAGFETGVLFRCDLSAGNCRRREKRRIYDNYTIRILAREEK